MLSPGSRLGKYHIERSLGRGGMGAVFLATDTVLRRPVAIKVLAADKTDVSPARLLREARSASALNHPNIVAVYEINEEHDVPFISMEFVEGQPLSELVEGGPLTVEQSIRYGIEAADALAHAHDRGIVHSDLKAANAIVSSSGRVKLVDFGIANRVRSVDSDATATSTATEQRALAGTPYSMAPEQVRGAEIDPRTDVWALGVLLYEMLSGARPFAAPTLPELFSAILRDSAPPLPVHVPNGLQVIVRKCLAKHPADRYESAADVRLALEIASGGEPLGSPGPRPAVMTGGPLPPPPFVNALPDATAFVGREAEIAQMTRVWDQARVGRRHLLLLAGEPGIGKTRLATEFARQCAAQVATVLAGRSDEEALIPYQPFAEALTWYARVCPEPELRAILDAIGGGGELAPIVVELMRRIPDLRTSLKSEGEGERYRLFDVIDALLAAASSIHPIVLVLDDLHWADRPTLLLLKHLMRSTRTASLCIVGTYRDSELRRTHPLAEILADLRRDESVTRLSLDGLTGTDVLELAPSITGHSVSSRLAALVMEGAGGNPFFIGELLRHLRETDSLRSSLEDIDLGLPEGVKEVIGRRLSRLSEECNRALALAAVIGREFDVELLIALGDLSEDHLLDALDEAVRAQLIAEAVSSRGRLAFRHALIRETLYGELLSVRRIRLHRRVAEAIEERAGGRANPPLADLAYHFSQAASVGTADKAVEYAMRAGDRASELLAYEDAARMYELALQSIEFASGPNLVARRVDLHIRRARAFGSLGQWAAEKDDALRALELLDPEDLERRAELVLMVADASFYLLDSSSVDRYASEALDLARQVNRDDLAADAMGWLGRSLQARGELAGAIEMDNRAISLGKPRRGVALMHGPLTLYLAGHSHEATKQGRRAAETARTGRDTELTMYALSHYGLGLGAIGRYRDAARTFEEARAFGRKYGVLPPLARATSMSGGFHVSVFDLDGAESIHTEARELARSLNFVPTIVSSGIDLLFVHVRRHDPGRAQVLLPEVETAAAATPGWHDWLWQGRLKQVRAELALACGDASLALDRAQDTVEFCRAKGRVKYQALAHITAARALRALGRTQEAIAHARDALAIARPISDPALLLWALNVLLMLAGDDGLAREARTVSHAISIELPDEAMQRRFAESDLAQVVPRG